MVTKWSPIFLPVAGGCWQAIAKFSAISGTESDHVFGHDLAIDETERIIKLKSQDDIVSQATYDEHETQFETLRDYFAQGYIMVTYDIDLGFSTVATNVQIYRPGGYNIQIGGPPDE